MTRREAILADLQVRTLTDAEIARRHGVTRSWVGKIRRAAGIPPWWAPHRPGVSPPRERSPVYWTDADIAYLIAHGDDPVAAIAAALGRGITTVYEMRHRLAGEGRLPRRRVPMSEVELTLLANPGLTHADIAQRTGRTPQVIADARRRRGIRGVRR
jgi:hypothetical protein